MNCEDVQCFVKYSNDVVASLKGDISWWSTVNLGGQLFIAFCGIVSALVIALNEKSKLWKGIGIAATILVTGTTSLLEETLHVRATTDKLIEIAGNVAKAANKFERDSDGKSGDELRNLMKSYADEFNAQQLERLKILGSAGKLKESLEPVAAKK